MEIKFPKTKKELEHLVEKYGEIRLYISNNEVYAYTNKITKERLGDKKIYWVFQTTNNYFDFCHKCCQYINGDHHCYNDDHDKIIDTNGQIKDYNWPYRSVKINNEFEKKRLKWIDELIETLYIK